MNNFTFAMPKKLVPSLEQENIISLAASGKSLLIQAFAGAAKTSTCVMIAEALPQKSCLYISFNKSIALEAQEKFPSNVVCKTLHSLAWKGIIRHKNSAYDRKLSSGLSYYVKPELRRIITEYCQSAEKDLAKFYDLFPEIKVEKQEVLNYWTDLVNERHPEKISHDVYLKLFQLSNPVLDYDIIFLDELQDSNPITLDIWENQKAQLIGVGDPYQSIYAWRGAVNAFDSLNKEKFTISCLTESYRFHPGIAELAFSITECAENHIPIVGKGTQTNGKSYAILTRTNLTILNLILEAREEEKIFCTSDMSDVWSKMWHIAALSKGEKPKYPNSELMEFKTWKDFLDECEENSSLSLLLKIYYRLCREGGLKAGIDLVKSRLVKDQSEASLVLSTIHKSKGLEWDMVKIEDDIIPRSRDRMTKRDLMDSQWFNLLYVAVTRARSHVSMTEELENMIKDMKELELDDEVFLPFVSSEEEDYDYE